MTLDEVSNMTLDQISEGGSAVGIYPEENYVMANAGTYGPLDSPMTPSLALWKVLEEAGGSLQLSQNQSNNANINATLKRMLKKCQEQH
jgi:hypothetical protein